MIRDHKICSIVVRFRQKYRTEDSAGNGSLITETGTTEKVLLGLFPTIEIARVWAEGYGKHFVDFQIVDITALQPDVCIIQPTW